MEGNLSGDTFFFYRGEGKGSTTAPCMCGLMGAHIRLNLPPALSLDVSLPARALTNTHTYAHAPWGHNQDIWRRLSEFSSISRDLLTRLAATGISVTVAALSPLVVCGFADTLQICSEGRKLSFSSPPSLFLTACLSFSSQPVLLIEVSFFIGLSCRLLVMQILMCSFALLAIN